jgi:hypothetical protein
MASGNHLLALGVRNEWAYEVHNQVCMGNLESQKCIRICWCPPHPQDTWRFPGYPYVKEAWAGGGS